MRAVALINPAVAALLASCGTLASPTAPAVNVPQADAATTAAPSAPAQPAGELSERNNLIKKVGEGSVRRRSRSR